MSFAATGHGAEGLLLGPYSALVVARAMLGIESSVDPKEQELATRILDRYALATVQLSGRPEPQRRSGSLLGQKPTAAMIEPLRWWPAMSPLNVASPKG